MKVYGRRLSKDRCLLSLQELKMFGMFLQQYLLRLALLESISEERQNKQNNGLSEKESPLFFGIRYEIMMCLIFLLFVLCRSCTQRVRNYYLSCSFFFYTCCGYRCILRFKFNLRQRTEQHSEESNQFRKEARFYLNINNILGSLLKK